MPRLIHLAYSPWSEQARWALEHHRVEVERVAYLPMIGEPALRLVSRRPWRKPSVPMLLDGRAVLRDSFDIARWAEERGSGPTLFPELAAVRAWNHVAEEVRSAGRALTTQATLKDPVALEESLPAPMPGHPALRPVARMGAHFLAAKYGARGAESGALMEVMRRGLETMREALDGGRYLVGDAFSYADIVAATALQFVRPVSNAFIPLGPHSRVCWTRAPLAREFEGLVAWRDALYRDHRLRAEG